MLNNMKIRTDVHTAHIKSDFNKTRIKITSADRRTKLSNEL